MEREHHFLKNLRETLLVITVLYFYGLAFAINFQKDTYGADAPAVFLSIAALFLVALCLEAIVVWWEKRFLILWSVCWVLAYGIAGLFYAPRIFGEHIMAYVLLEPILLTFVGGFAYAYGTLLSGSFFPSRRLSAERLTEALGLLPGWSASGDMLHKTYTFTDFAGSLNFVNQVSRVADAMSHHPGMDIHFNTVIIHTLTPEEKGVTQRDILFAHRCDALIS
jgi:4a-hydroxytetrahydrobiopterin dehydratase